MKTVFLFIAIICLTGSVNAQKTINLLDQTDLSDWSFVVEDNNAPASDVFYVRDGILTISGNPFGYMYTNDIYTNYHLQVEWRWPQGKESNSGIFLFVEDILSPFPKCVECQLMAGKAGDFVLINGSDLAEYKDEPNTTRPKFPIVPKANNSSENPAGEWNKADIYCYNGVVIIYINGIFQNKGTSKVKEGRIALQSEGDNIQFRTVTLTPLF